MVWVKIDDRFDEHPKMAAVGPLGIALWVTGLAYCNRNLTDGFIPRSVAKTLVDWTQADGDGTEWDVSLTRTFDDMPAGTGVDVTSDLVIEKLVAERVWDKTRGGYLVHDFGDYQPTRAEIEEMTRQKVAAGRAGGLAAARARGRTNGRAPAQAESNPEPEPEPEPEPVPGSEPEAEAEPFAAGFVDELSNLDASDPVDAWSMLSNGRELTPKQREAVAGWVRTEGKPQVVELMIQAWTMKGAGAPAAQDPFGSIKAIILARRSGHIRDDAVDDQRRREAQRQSALADEADPQYARLRRQALDLGLAQGLDMTGPLPTTVTGLEGWLADHDEGRTDD